MKERPPRSPCPVSCTLEILGDRWTLIVVRDLFAGATRYQDFLNSPEGITTSVLAERLKRLERYGIIAKTPYQENPLRYEYSLTDTGRDLAPLMDAMVAWAKAHEEDVISRSA
jgi:DNA-binding HxlR family transcriptional regulator